MKQELILEGLNCANCAVKIEGKVKEIRGVTSAHMNFINKTLYVEWGIEYKYDELVQLIQEVVDNVESGVVVRAKVKQLTNNSKYMLLGLDCANCALKIEKEIRKIPGIKEASVDFINKKLTVLIEDENREQVYQEIKKVVKSIESHVKVVIDEKSDNQKLSLSQDLDRWELARIIAGGALFALGILVNFQPILNFALFTVAYLLVGSSVLLKAIRNISKGQIFDENFLMSIATIGAFAIGEFPEAVAVMLFYKVGEYIQGIAVNKSRRSISALMDIRPDYANLKTETGLNKVSPEGVKLGDIIVVKPGEKVPLDGIILEGYATLDTSALTGESLPREVATGSEVLSGSVNTNGVITVKVTKEYGESTVSKILDLVENATSKKAPTENFITKFARYYTPVVVVIAFLVALIPPLVIADATFYVWIYRALVFLVISCPCALVISIPLGFFGGIGAASKKGILVKGSNFLEALNDVELVVFDKTGTLTKGTFTVTDIGVMENVDKNQLIKYAAYVESYSNHPIAKSITAYYGKEIDKDKIANYQEIAGKGIIAEVEGQLVLAGNSRLMVEEDIKFQPINDIGTVVYVAVDQRYIGYIVIADQIKEDSKKAISMLKDLGVREVTMLTGDNASIAEKVSREINIDKFYAELLPHQKVEKIEELFADTKKKGNLLFVGDGINDAPVLARADVGLAMGGVGSDAAIEAADVVLMTDELSKIPVAIKVAKRTRSIVWQNIIFSLGVKFIVLVLGAFGLASIWEAVFADVGVTIIAVLNALRVLNIKN